MLNWLTPSTSIRSPLSTDGPLCCANTLKCGRVSQDHPFFETTSFSNVRRPPMRVSARSVSALIAFCASTAWAQTQQTIINPVASSGPIYITHVTVIDTETGKEFRDRTVHISGDRISEVKESKDLAL